MPKPSSTCVTLVFLLSVVLFAATEAQAMKISEAHKMTPSERGAYIVMVIDAHLGLVGMKDLDLAKKTEIDMFTPNQGLYQGVADIVRYMNVFKEKGLADKVDVELVCRLIFDQVWKQKGWTHEGKVANSSMFFPQGYQVPYKPATKPEEQKKPEQAAPAK